MSASSARDRNLSEERQPERSGHRGRDQGQLEQQLGTTASQVQGAEQAQASKEQNQAGKAATVTASVNKQLRAVRSSRTQVQNTVNTLNTTTATQGTDIKNLQKDVDKLDTRVSNLGG